MIINHGLTFSTCDDVINSPISNNALPSSVDRSSPKLHADREIILSTHPTIVTLPNKFVMIPEPNLVRNAAMSVSPYRTLVGLTQP